MRRKPTLYNSDLKDDIMHISCRSDKLGNVYYYVEYVNGSGTKDYVRFAKMQSVIDFINSNF